MTGAVLKYCEYLAPHRIFINMRKWALWEDYEQALHKEVSLEQTLNGLNGLIDGLL